MDANKYGHLAEDPMLEATIPTLVDPSLAPEGKHVMSVLFQAAPRKLRDRDWASERDGVADIAVKSMERFAPGLGELVEAREVITPEDMETGYGLTGGHVYHAEPGLDQFFAWRPLNGEARYRCRSTGCTSRIGRASGAASPAAPGRTPPARSSRTRSRGWRREGRRPHDVIDSGAQPCDLGRRPQGVERRALHACGRGLASSFRPIDSP